MNRTLIYTDFFGKKIELTPRVELYTVYDFMGSEMPGLAIVLDTIGDEPEEYGVLTVSFGEMIGLKDCAYIDTNNMPGAMQMLKDNPDFAENTGLTHRSGFCVYPLWHFKKKFLEECGGENYREYSEAYDEYFRNL